MEKKLVDALETYKGRMAKVLEENSHKSGWDDLSIFQLMDGIIGEFRELYDEYVLAQQHHPLQKKSIKKLQKEAIDISNWCMFLVEGYQVIIDEEEQSNESDDATRQDKSCGIKG